MLGFVNNHVRSKACSALSPVLGDDDLECAEVFALVKCFILHNGLTPEMYFLLGILRDCFMDCFMDFLQRKCYSIPLYLVSSYLTTSERH